MDLWTLSSAVTVWKFALAYSLNELAWARFANENFCFMLVFHCQEWSRNQVMGTYILVFMKNLANCLS